MEQELLIKLLLMVAQIVMLVVGGFVVNYLKTKLGTEKFHNYLDIVKQVISAVEQTLGSGNGAGKKEEATKLIKSIIGDKLTDEQISTFIEAAVFQMNTILKDKKAS